MMLIIRSVRGRRKVMMLSNNKLIEIVFTENSLLYTVCVYVKFQRFSQVKQKTKPKTQTIFLKDF